jgi:hypothetical protein
MKVKDQGVKDGALSLPIVLRNQGGNSERPPDPPEDVRTVIELIFAGHEASHFGSGIR